MEVYCGILLWVDHQNHFCVDRRIFKDLYTVADLRALSRIVNAKVDEDYFSAIHRAIERSKVHGELIVISMGDLPYPDAAAQIADYFLKYRKVSKTFSIGFYDDMILMSLRSDDPASKLGVLARKVIGGMGTAGGHGSSAGGQVPVAGKSPEDIELIEKKIIETLLRELGLENETPRRLIQDIPE